MNMKHYYTGDCLSHSAHIAPRFCEKEELFWARIKNTHLVNNGQVSEILLSSHI